MEQFDFKRKIYEDFSNWKNRSHGKSALFVEGARRVGKSYAIKKFASSCYRTSIIVEFDKVTNEFLSLFDDIMDMDLFYAKLSAVYNVELFRRESLIVFDEVQLFPKARALIKRFVEDGRYDFIETGSLVTLMMNPSRILIPSEEEHIEMFPFDFEEFLWALGDNVTIPYLKECFEKKTQIGNAVHKKVMNQFRQYILIGGMPQAIKAYVENKSFEDADLAKKSILTLYRQDIGKFAGKSASKVRAIFEFLPAMLYKHEKRFNLSSLGKNARKRDYEDAFLWLDDAMVINPCYNSTDVSVGLALNADETRVKCYLSDTGLLVSHAFADKNFINNELYKAILLDKLNINEGMLIENVVAQLLRCHGHHLYYHKFKARSFSDYSNEIDFLILKDKKICPIEVKSGRSVNHISLDYFREKYNKRLGQAYILCRRDITEKNGILYLPLYMAQFL